MPGMFPAQNLDPVDQGSDCYGLVLVSGRKAGRSWNIFNLYEELGGKVSDVHSSMIENDIKMSYRISISTRMICEDVILERCVNYLSSPSFHDYLSGKCRNTDGHFKLPYSVPCLADNEVLSSFVILLKRL